MGFETRLPWIHIPTDSYCVTLGKLFNLHDYELPCVWNEDEAQLAELSAHELHEQLVIGEGVVEGGGWWWFSD